MIILLLTPSPPGEGWGEGVLESSVRNSPVDTLSPCPLPEGEGKEGAGACTAYTVSIGLPLSQRIQSIAWLPTQGIVPPYVARS